MRIIDSHVHFWDLARINPPWLYSSPALAPIATSFLENDYRAALAGWSIEAAIYLEVDAAAAQHAEEAKYAAELCADSGSLVQVAVIGGHPGSKEFRTHVASWKAPSVKGVRQVLQVPEAAPGCCLMPEFVQDVRWLGEQGLSFDLCMRSSELDDGIRLIIACPETPFILDHCGNPNVSSRDQDAWRRSIRQMAKLPNVSCKLSGLIESAPPGTWSAQDLAPFVLHVLDSFGPERVLYGSNWPVCNLNGSAAAWLAALQEILSDLSDAERRQIFVESARRVYRME